MWFWVCGKLSEKISISTLMPTSAMMTGLDLLEDFIRETIPANIYWLEEMITHDVTGYRAMREMQAKHGSKALLVCGETDRDPISETFRHLIEDGLIDGYQPDIVGAGYLRWIEIDGGTARNRGAFNSAQFWQRHFRHLCDAGIRGGV